MASIVQEALMVSLGQKILQTYKYHQKTSRSTDLSVSHYSTTNLPVPARLLLPAVT